MSKTKLLINRMSYRLALKVFHLLRDEEGAARALHAGLGGMFRTVALPRVLEKIVISSDRHLRRWTEDFDAPTALIKDLTFVELTCSADVLQVFTGRCSNLEVLSIDGCTSLYPVKAPIMPVSIYEFSIAHQHIDTMVLRSLFGDRRMLPRILVRDCTCTLPPEALFTFIPSELQVHGSPDIVEYHGGPFAVDRVDTIGIFRLPGQNLNPFAVSTMLERASGTARRVWLDGIPSFRLYSFRQLTYLNVAVSLDEMNQVTTSLETFSADRRLRNMRLDLFVEPGWFFVFERIQWRRFIGGLQMRAGLDELRVRFCATAGGDGLTMGRDLVGLYIRFNKLRNLQDAAESVFIGWCRTFFDERFIDRNCIEEFDEIFFD